MMASPLGRRAARIRLMRAQSGQELVQVAMTLPVLVLVIIMGCWIFLWQLGLHSTQFIAQESARAATITTGLASDPDAASASTFPDADDTNGTTDIGTIASNAQSAAQGAIDRSFLHGIASGSPCSSGTPPSGQVCFVQKVCTQGAGNCDAGNEVAACLGSASSQQALWVCEWYEVPASGSPDPYKVKVAVVGWYSIGVPIFGGSLPVVGIDEESIQRCGGCPA